MIALDTNILVYAHRGEMPLHPQAKALLIELVRSGRPWALPWACVHEFLVVVTQTVFRPPSTLAQAFDAIEAIVATGTAQLIGEGPRHLARLREQVERSGITGSRLFDARIAAICLANGVKELWSIDRDFSRFPDLKVVNPLVK